MGAPLSPGVTHELSSEPLSAGFDFQAPADLFLGRRFRGRGGVGYRRFASAARAVGFVVEDLAERDRIAAVLEVGDARFRAGAIRGLYDRADYPLARRPLRTAAAALPTGS